MPVTLVLHLRSRDAFVLLRVAGVGHDHPPVQQRDVRPKLVHLAVIGGVAGHDREVNRCAGQRPGRGPAGGPRHRVGHLEREKLLSPVAPDDAYRASQRRVEVGEPVKKLGAARRLVIHDVRIGQVHNAQQRRRRSLPAGSQAGA